MISPPSIDVVAHHELQWQSCAAVVTELRKTYRCNALIGQDAQPTGAEIAILVDHCAFQSRVSKKNYSFLIHMSHDLADFDIYADEREMLRDIDLFLVPGEKHCLSARKAFPDASIFKIGWPKFETNLGPIKDLERLHPLASGQKVLLYAPTYLHTWEWEELLPALLRTEHLVVIKNHVYYNFEAGEPPPKGCEKEYAEAIASLMAMEAWLASCEYQNYVNVDRRSNLCALFPHMDVLVTDSSSCAIEFLPFGPCIETGRFGPSRTNIAPNGSCYSDAVTYTPIDDLLARLEDIRWINDLTESHHSRDRSAAGLFIHETSSTSSKYAAEVIDAHLSLWRDQRDRRKGEVQGQPLMMPRSTLLRRKLSGHVKRMLDTILQGR